ncbi:MAG: GerAB/ArcD/ProY family transporter [Clostridia bacterium]|nr:GerAB/ArcD/ProY family transporter [Clostridia bacterium]
MEKKTVFGHWDVTFVVVNAIIVKLVYYFMNIFTLISARGGFICALIISGAFILLGLFYNKIYSIITITDFGFLSEKALGKFLKKLSFLLYVICFVFNTGNLLTFYTASVMNMMLPLSSVKVLLTLIIVTAFVITTKGLKTIVRIHGLFTPLLLMIMLVASIAMFTKANPDNFFPIFGYGIDSILYCSLFTFSYFYEVIFMLFLMPDMAKTEERKKTIKLTCIFSISVLILLLGAYIGSVPFPANTNILSVLMFIANSMNFPTPLKEILLVFMIGYTINIIIYTATNMYFAAKLYSEAFNISQIFPVRIGISLLIAVSALAAGTVDTTLEVYKYFQPVLWISGIILPALVLIKGYRNEKK